MRSCKVGQKIESYLKTGVGRLLCEPVLMFNETRVVQSLISQLQDIQPQMCNDTILPDGYHLRKPYANIEFFHHKLWNEKGAEL